MSELEDMLLALIRVAGLPEPLREHRFSARRFRFDLCWPEQRVACELQGATWSGGKHTRGSGYESDCEKLNLAQELGWRVYWFTGSMVEDGRALAMLERVLR